MEALIICERLSLPGHYRLDIKRACVPVPSYCKAYKLRLFIVNFPRFIMKDSKVC